MKRRTLIKAALGGLLPFSDCYSGSGETPERSLGSILADRALFGAAFDTAVFSDPLYASLLKRHCGILTTDWSLKFGSLRPENGEANFEHADKLIGFANGSNIPVRGHTLIWNEWQPKWLKSLNAKEVAYWLDRHVSELVGRYEGRMHSWDVVNEPFWPDHHATKGFRKGVWFDALGEGYIDRAFRIANASDRNVRLCINEAYTEHNTKMAGVVRDGLYGVLLSLLDRGLRVDAVGLQCHLRPDKSLDLNILSDFIGRLSSLPIDVYITELDVRDGGAVMSDENNRERFAADCYRAFSKTVLSHNNVKAIICWQLSDKYSWLKKEGKAVSPLPFNEDMKPNLAYFALANEFSVRN